MTRQLSQTQNNGSEKDTRYNTGCKVCITAQSLNSHLRLPHWQLRVESVCCSQLRVENNGIRSVRASISPLAAAHLNSQLRISTRRFSQSACDTIQPPLPAQLPQPTPHALCTIDCHSELTDDWIMTLSCEPLYCLVFYDRGQP